MSLRWRMGSTIALVLLLAYLAAANLVPVERRLESAWLPDTGVRLGLDLQGGVHIVLGPELDAAIGHELSAIQDSLEQELDRRKVTGTRLVLAGQTLTVRPATAEDAEAVREILADYDTLNVRDQGEYELELTLTDDWAVQVRERAMLQSLEVLRRRLGDPETGIAESVITRQGRDRILVQMPGVDRVPKDILDKTGHLEFKIVEDVDATEELLLARYPDGLPEGTQVALETDRETDRVLNAYLVPEQADISGEYLTDARAQFDNRVNEWQVNFTWSAEGGKIFGALTEANLQEPLAIIMDHQVYSAPQIQSRISRQGVITGNFSSAEASDLSVILRAGSLPIGVTIEEERTVGPSLGADSIRRGLQACLAGLLLVVLFSIGYYRLSGGFASLALLANLVMVVGLMSIFEGTLTLPGLAGLVLTVGMAVDANVIIFERIREELRAGRAPRAAISTGFQKARWTILDANITTLITAIVLYNYGTGPIKGFAVTLSVGILTSVFAALVITRLLFHWKPGESLVSELSI